MLRFKTFCRDILFEVKLTPAALVAPNGKTGEARLDILYRLIKDKIPLELEAGGEFVVTDQKAAYKEINNFKANPRKPFELIGKKKGSRKIETISSSDLKKSAVFGGGGGSAGGSANTDLAESAQAYYCSAVVNVLGREGKAEDFTESVLRKAAKNVFATTDIDKVIKNLPEDWVESSILTANILYREGYIQKGHNFHRGSSRMTAVYKAAKQAQKNSQLSPIADDKWNPGDIWAMVPAFKPETGNVLTINEYNNDIINAFLNRKAVAISLKKVVKSAHIERFNIEPAREKHNYRGYGLSSAKGGGTIDNFFSSKGIAVHVDESILEGRTFNYMSNFAVDIRGKHSRGGKIGLGPLNNVLKLNGVKELSSTGQLKSSIKKMDKNFLNHFYTLFNKVNPWGHMTRDEFLKRVKKRVKESKGEDWLISKYINLELINIIEGVDKKKQEKIVGGFLAYAASSTQISSAFIKVA